MKRFLTPLAILVAGLLIMLGLTQLKQPQKKRPVRPVVKVVETLPVDYRTEHPEITALGKIVSEHPVRLAAEVNGKAVPTGFVFKTGATFKKGQRLFKIDDRQASIQVRSLISDLMNTLASFLPEIRHDIPDAYQRWKTFFDSLSFDHLPALPKAETQQEKLFLSRFNVYKLYFAAAGQKIQLAKYTLRAPFTGIVASADTRPGDMVSAGRVIGNLIRTDRYEIEIPLPLAEITWVQNNAQTTVHVEETGENLTGQVLRIAKAVDPSSQTVSAFVGIRPQPDQAVYAGAYATVGFKGAAVPHALAVPRTCLFDSNRVYVIENGKLSARTVSIAYRGIETALITGGLTPGIQLVAEPVQGAVEDMTVQAAPGGRL